jgi:hypothetical protein
VQERIYSFTAFGCVSSWTHAWPRNRVWLALEKRAQAYTGLVSTSDGVLPGLVLVFIAEYFSIHVFPWHRTSLIRLLDVRPMSSNDRDTYVDIEFTSYALSNNKRRQRLRSSWLPKLLFTRIFRHAKISGQLPSSFGHCSKDRCNGLKDIFPTPWSVKICAKLCRIYDLASYRNFVRYYITGRLEICQLCKVPTREPCKVKESGQPVSADSLH